MSRNDTNGNQLKLPTKPTPPSPTLGYDKILQIQSIILKLCVDQMTYVDETICCTSDPI